MIKVSVLSQKSAKKSNPRLACMIFQKIYLIYQHINSKEERNSDMLLTIMSEHEQAIKVNKEFY